MSLLLQFLTHVYKTVVETRTQVRSLSQLLNMPKGTKSNYDQSQWVVQSVDAPFKLYRIRNVFNDCKYVSKLYKEVEKLKFSHSSNDMFSMRQTLDLYYLKNHPKFPMLNDFLHFLDDLKLILSKELGVDLEPQISVSSSKYCKNDFLLCHDDHSEERYVAFIFYLNPEWKSEWGGSLDIFEHDADGQPSQIKYNICPEFNSLVFFQVGNRTYHQVAEVVSDETPRLTINGWFYSKEARNIKSLPYFDRYTFVQTHDTGALMYLQHFINNNFLTKVSQSLICDTWKENNVVMLQEFLKPFTFERLGRLLNSPSIRWKQKGPANRRKYDIAEENSLPPLVSALLCLVRSNSMCSYLETITGQNLFNATDENGAKHGLVHAEIQSWKSTCYSLLHDSEIQLSEVQRSNGTFEMWIFFNVQKDVDTATDSEDTQSGNIFYCSESSSTPDREIEPANNSVCWVRKRENQSIFVSYINAKSNLKYHALRVCYKI